MKIFAMTLLFAASLTLVGCGSSTQAPKSSPQAEHEDHEGHDHDAHPHDDHAHPSEGPHHGSLIELGNEDYHGELVHDHATGSVTIYLLDSARRAGPRPCDGQRHNLPARFGSEKCSADRSDRATRQPDPRRRSRAVQASRQPSS